MNKTQEALKMAIEVMEEGFGTLECEGMLPHRYQEAIQTCKEALAELEQQPKVTGFIRTLETIDKDGIETWKLEPFFTLQSLQEHDNEVIERCAKICDEMNNEYGWGKVAANTIRLLKGKQNET